MLTSSFCASFGSAFWLNSIFFRFWAEHLKFDARSGFRAHAPLTSLKAAKGGLVAPDGFYGLPNWPCIATQITSRALGPDISNEHPGPDHRRRRASGSGPLRAGDWSDGSQLLKAGLL